MAVILGAIGEASHGGFWVISSLPVKPIRLTISIYFLNDSPNDEIIVIHSCLSVFKNRW